jgi:alkanesulfonate monooxygenase SsuD/methylene tetrahydromethanopterin reductase-like flavin-dependent oxidoreductase (luciferase family)
MRALWSSDTQRIHLPGKYYTVDGVRPGPAPAHPIEIWSGAVGPKALRLTGELFDGWAAPIPSYLPYEKWPEANRILDDAALAAGRQPTDVRRIAQIVGTITDQAGDVQAETGAAPIRGNAGQWAELLTRLATEQPYTSFVFWPEEQTIDQVTRFARDVAPKVRN